MHATATTKPPAPAPAVAVASRDRCGRVSAAPTRDQRHGRRVLGISLQHDGGVPNRLTTIALGREHLSEVHPQRNVVRRGLHGRPQASHKRVRAHDTRIVATR